MARMKKEEVKAELDNLGVSYEPDASYSELTTALKNAQGDVASGEDKGKEDTPESSERLSMDSKTAEGAEKEEEQADEPTSALNVFSSFETKTPMTGKAHAMRKKLMNEPKVMVMIPLGTDEKLGATQQVTLNGYTMFIRKGQYLDVPLSVKNVLEAKMQHELNVRNHPHKLTGGVGSIELKSFD